MIAVWREGPMSVNDTPGGRGGGGGEGRGKETVVRVDCEGELQTMQF